LSSLTFLWTRETQLDAFHFIPHQFHMGAAKSLARPGRTQAKFLSEWREFPSNPCLAGGGELDDSSRLDVVVIVSVPDMLPSLFPSWSG